MSCLFLSQVFKFFLNALKILFHLLKYYSFCLCASLVAQTVKNLPTMQKTQAQDPLKRGTATHSSIFCLWTEEPGRLYWVAKSRT